MALGHDVHLLSLEPSHLPGVTDWPLEASRLLTTAARFRRQSPLLNRIKRPAVAGPIKHIFLIPRTRAILARLQPDVVDAHLVTNFGMYGLARCRRTPFVATVYGGDVVRPRYHRMVAWLVRLALRRADLIYSSSSISLKDIKDSVRLDVREKFRSHTWGIPIDSICLDAEERRVNLRAKMGVSSDTMVCLHNRTMSEHWRILTILDCIPRVVAARPRTEFWFAYREPDYNGEKYLTKVRRRIRELNIDTHVRLLGPQSPEAVFSLLHAADLYLCLGHRDLLASSVLEALCAKKIPILSNIPAYHQVLDRDSVFYLEKVNHQNLAEKILRLAEDPSASREELAPYATSVREHYGCLQATRRLVEFYREASTRFESLKEGS